MRHAAAEIDGLSAAARQVRALAVAAAAAAAWRGTIDLARGRSDARFRCCPHGAARRHAAACPGLRRPETTILEPELRNENPKVISVWTMPTTDRERQSQARACALGAYVYGFKVGGVA